MPRVLFAAFVFLALAATAFAQNPVPPQEAPEIVRFFGRLHPMLLHLPIGLLAGVAVLEIISLRRRSEALAQAIKVLLPLGVLLAVFTAMFGLFLSWETIYDAKLLSWHKWTGIAVAGFGLVALMLHRAHQRKESPALLHGYRASLFAGVVAIIIAGHFGGSLTHGEAYLFEYMPFYQKPTEISAAPAPAEGHEYTTVIQPIIEEHCYTCHGPGRQRGGLRLDELDAALAGGKSGNPAIEPGDPMSSALVERILMPRDVPGAMPPGGREGLTPEETLAVIHWIQRGAEWGE